MIDSDSLTLLAGEAGLRRGEIIALDLNDADFPRGQLTIARPHLYRPSRTTKGGKTRRGPTTTRLTAALQAIRHLRGARILYQRNGEPVSENTLRSWWMRPVTESPPARSARSNQLRRVFSLTGSPLRW